MPKPAEIAPMVNAYFPHREVKSIATKIKSVGMQHGNEDLLADFEKIKSNGYLDLPSPRRKVT